MDFEGALGAIQMLVAAFAMGVIISNLTPLLPNGGPFADTIAFIAALPWILVVLSILALITMILGGGSR